MTEGVLTAIRCNPFFDARAFLFASKLFFLVIATKLRLETLPRIVFLWLANFFCVDLLCIRIETG